MPTSAGSFSSSPFSIIPLSWCSVISLWSAYWHAFLTSPADSSVSLRGHCGAEVWCWLLASLGTSLRNPRSSEVAWENHLRIRYNRCCSGLISAELSLSFICWWTYYYEAGTRPREGKGSYIVMEWFIVIMMINLGVYLLRQQQVIWQGKTCVAFLPELQILPGRKMGDS